MWKVQYKPNNDAQPWTVKGYYESKSQACIQALRIASEYFKVEVMDQKGIVIWSNYN